MTALLKERRRLYRKEPESERIGEINEALKEARKKIRLTVQIEQHSLEIEARLRQAEELEHTDSRSRHREKQIPERS